MSEVAHQALPLSSRDPNYLVLRSQLAPDYGITYSRMHLHRLAKAGKFPSPLVLSPNRRAYRHGDLMAWINSRAPIVGGHE